MQRSLMFLCGAALLGAGTTFGAWMVAPEKTIRAGGEIIDSFLGPAEAQAETGGQTFSPVKALANRDVYYPGTEDVDPTRCG